LGLAAAALAGHVGGRAGLIDKDQFLRVKPRLQLAFPALAGARHVRTLLLRGVHGFF
jgi:hypothetical protein